MRDDPYPIPQTHNIHKSKNNISGYLEIESYKENYENVEVAFEKTTGSDPNL